MRILAFGGRAYSDAEKVAREIDAHWGGNGCVLVCGYDPDDQKFQGADQLAYEHAINTGKPVAPFPARWTLFGRSAGPRRNQRMLDCMKPVLGLQFPGGAGTADMARRLKAAGVRVIEIE